MASIKPGQYTAQEIFDIAGFDFREKAGADYLDGEPDHRRVKVGGLSIDSVDDLVHVPYTADSLILTVDGNEDTKLDLDLSAEDKKARKASFESAVDAPSES